VEAQGRARGKNQERPGPGRRRQEGGGKGGARGANEKEGMPGGKGAVKRAPARVRLRGERK
jgi:hypothetical protein